MLRFYLRLTIIMLPMFALLMIAMSAIGSTQPIHPALRGFVEGCEGIPQPCWYGIVPDVTTEEQGIAILVSEGFERGSPYRWLSQDNAMCQFQYGLADGIIVNFEITLCSEIMVGDVLMLENSSPTSVTEGICGYLFIKLENLLLIANNFSMYGQIRRIRYNPDDQSNTVAWHGFATVWRYHQLGTLSCLSPNG